MSDPVEWLSNRLDGVEAVAQAAIRKNGVGKWYSCGKSVSSDSNEIEIYDEGGHTREQAIHIAMCDPATVLRLVAATRAVLEIHGQTLGCVDDMVACMSCGTADEYAVDWPCATVKALAAGWGWVDE